MDLAELRARIDAVDLGILSLLDERMCLAARAAPLKPDPRDPGREAEVLARARTFRGKRLDPGFAERLFALIVEESARLQGG